MTGVLRLRSNSKYIRSASTESKIAKHTPSTDSAKLFTRILFKHFNLFMENETHLRLRLRRNSQKSATAKSLLSPRRTARNSA